MTSFKKMLYLQTGLASVLLSPAANAFDQQGATPVGVAAAAEAETEAEDELETGDGIVVVGSRREGRTAINSPVPVDILSVEELDKTHSPDIKDSLAAVSPSYEVLRDASRDEASLVRGTSLRGLSPGQVVVLLNGKRVHRGATMKYDEQAADVSQYVSSSLKSVQVLRDGAAAQYGADAVAGVVNLILKDEKGISGTLGYGKYYAGDGRSLNASSHVGIGLGQRGHLNVTASYAHQAPSNRASEQLQAKNQFDLKLPGYDKIPLKDLIAPYGIAKSSRLNFVWNASVEVNDDAEFYLFGNYGKSFVDEPFQYRESLQRPDTGPLAGRAGGMRDTLYRTRMAFNHPDPNFRLSSGNAYLGARLLTNANGDIINSAGQILRTAAGQDVMAGTPVYLAYGYGAIDLFPGGYIPYFQIHAEDVAVFAGFKGEFSNGLRWDVSASLGRNSNKYSLRDTINASLGAPIGTDGRPDPSKVQTSFDAGAVVSSEKALSAEFSYPLKIDGIKGAFLSFGAEYRSDRYQKFSGELASWQTGPLKDLKVGSDGFQGKDPGQQSNDERHNIAFYADAEFDITDDLSFGAAARYERFSDFGSTFNWKVAGRYQLFDALAIRGAASTGFHAPSVGQINDLNATTGFALGMPSYTARLPVAHPAAIVFGAKPLEPEKAFNMSAGLIITPSSRTSITVDLFSIKLKNRISSSRTYQRDNPVFAPQWAAFDASGFNGASSITSLYYFVNAVDTKSKGLELVAVHDMPLGAGDLKFTLGYAYITHGATNADELLLTETEIFNFKNPGIKHKGSFAAQYSIDKFSIYARARYFGTVLGRKRRGEISPDTGTPVWESPSRVMLDLNLQYDITENYAVTIGADNILDTYPKNLRWEEVLGRKYMPSGIPWDGGQYYINLTAKF